MGETVANGLVLAGRYERLGELGRGAMGVVLRVRDQALGEERALKTISLAGGTTEAARLRFKEEFRAMARLAHPNAVAVHDFGSLPDGQLYLVMALVPGEDLNARIARGQLPPSEAADLLCQLLRVLAFIHGRGYVHRDVKAANLRVGPDGHLTLMDFGLMAQIGRSGGAVSGTPGYLAPEAVQGGGLQPAVDLYAVGCLAYELLAGRLPHQGSVREVLRAHLNEKPVPLRQLAPKVTEALGRWVARMMAKDPKDRPASARAALEALAAAVGLKLSPDKLEAQRSFLVPSELVGREREWAHLHGAWGEARSGQGSAWLVEGPGGLGKSRLLAELALQARLDEALVLTLSCPEGGTAPFAALREALLPALALAKEGPGSAPPEAVVAILDAAQTGQACAEFQAGEGLCFQGIAEWLQGLSRQRPLLLLVEDVHWADAGVLGALSQLARAVESQAFLLVGSWRAEEAGPGHPVAQLLRDGLLQAFPLSPLKPQGVRRLVEAMLGEVAMGEASELALAKASGGNPFFVAEAVRVLMEESKLAREGGLWRFPDDPAALGVPSSVEAVVGQRLSRLCGFGRHLAESAAVVGSSVPLPRLLAVTELDEDQSFRYLDELTELQFLAREANGDYVFAHERVREVLLKRMGPEAKRSLHARVAQALTAEAERLAPAAAATLSSDRAKHLLAAGLDAEALPFVFAAARRAEALGADGVAAAWWAEALQAHQRLEDPARDGDRLEADLALGYQALIIRPELAAAALDDALAVLARRPELQGPHDLAELYGLLSVARALRGDPCGSGEAAAEAARRVPRDGSARDGAARFLACNGLIASGRFDEAIALAKESAAILGPLDPDGLRPIHRGARIVAYSHQNARAWQGEAPDPELLRLALEASAANQDPDPFSVWAPVGVHAALVGDAEALEAYLNRSLDRCRRLGAPPYGWVRVLRPWLLAHRGELAAARALLADALESPEVLHLGIGLGFAQALAGELALEAEDWPQAQRLFAQLWGKRPPDKAPFTAAWAATGLGAIALAEGHLAEARAHLNQALALCASGPGRNPWLAARARRQLGQLELTAHDPVAAKAQLEGALSTWQEGLGENPLEAARTRLVLSEALRQLGDRQGARQAVLRAGEAFSALGHRGGLTAATRAMERLHGATPRGPVPQADPAARWRLAMAMGG